MFEKIKNLVLSQMNEKRNSDKDITQCSISFLFVGVVLFFCMVALNCGILLLLSNILRITRPFMIIFVTIVELLVMFLLKNYSKYRDIVFPENSYKSKAIQMEEYYIKLSLIIYQSFIYNLFLVLPFLVAYGCYNSAKLLFYINSLFSVLLLSISTAFIDVTLSKYSIGKNKIFNFIGSAFLYFASIIFYIFVYLALEINLGINMISCIDAELYRQMCSFISEILKFFKTPLEIIKTGDNELINMPVFFAELSVKNLFNIMMISGMLLLFMRISKSIKRISILKQIEKLVKTNMKLSTIKANNTKVFRLNHTLKYCMPNSPPLK